MKKILVIGSINVDFVSKVESLPKPGQTIFSKNTETFFGGKGANQAVALAKMDCDVELIGVIGNDDNGKNYLNHLNKIQNLKTTNIFVSDKFTTGTANILVDDQGENNIVVNSNSNFDFDSLKLETIKDVIDDKDIIILQMEIPLNVTEEIINYSFSKNKIIVLNPSPVKKISKEVLQKVTYLVVNENELQDIFKIKTDKSIEIKDTIAKNLLLTLGKDGSIFFGKTEKFFVEAKTVKVVDTTCAGDAYLAGFVSCLSKGQQIDEAMEFATKVSSVVVTKNGAQSSLPTFAEVNEIE